MKLAEAITTDRAERDRRGWDEWQVCLELASGEIDGPYTRSTLAEAQNFVRLRCDGPKPPVAAAAIRYRYERMYIHEYHACDKYALIEETRPEWEWDRVNGWQEV